MVPVGQKWDPLRAACGKNSVLTRHQESLWCLNWKRFCSLGFSDKKSLSWWATFQRHFEHPDELCDTGLVKAVLSIKSLSSQRVFFFFLLFPQCFIYVCLKPSKCLWFSFFPLFKIPWVVCGNPLKSADLELLFYWYNLWLGHHKYFTYHSTASLNESRNEYIE